ncbi:MAG: PLDc N-terminal domain-containing protein [archaeon]
MAALLWLFGTLLLLLIAIAVFAFVFWILMIVDVAQRTFKDDGEKVAWVLIVILLGIIGAIIYYFIVKIRKPKQRKK